MHETPERDRGDGRVERRGAAGRMVCGAKRIRSLYLPSPTERPLKLSTTTPPKGPASVPVELGGYPPEPPQIRTSAINAYGSSGYGFATRTCGRFSDSATDNAQEGGGTDPTAYPCPRTPVQPLPPDTPHLLGEAVETAAVECDPIEAVVPQHLPAQALPLLLYGPVAIHLHHWYTLRTASFSFFLRSCAVLPGCLSETCPSNGEPKEVEGSRLASILGGRRKSTSRVFSS